MTGTGTGKTLAFALPVVEMLMKTPRTGKGPAALVIAPTRELALQVKNEFERVAPQLYSLCVYGGASYRPQETALSRGVDVLVGTPGRLKDHLERGNINLAGLRCIVLDEADRMLDQGFEDEMDAIIRAAKEVWHSSRMCRMASMRPMYTFFPLYRSNIVGEDRISANVFVFRHASGMDSNGNAKVYATR